MISPRSLGSLALTLTLAGSGASCASSLHTESRWLRGTTYIRCRNGTVVYTGDLSDGHPPRVHSFCGSWRAPVRCESREWRVRGLPELGWTRVHLPPRVAEVRLAGAHACARTEEGEVWCWGSGRFFEAGAPAGQDCEPYRMELPPAEAIAVAARLSCAVAEGGLWCWGDAAFGRRATDATIIDEGPQLVPLPEPVRSVAVDALRTCVLSQAGRIWCFGTVQTRDRSAEGLVTSEPVEGPRAAGGFTSMQLSEQMVCGDTSRRTRHCLDTRVSRSSPWTWTSDAAVESWTIDPAMDAPMRCVAGEVTCTVTRGEVWCSHRAQPWRIEASAITCFDNVVCATGEIPVHDDNGGHTEHGTMCRAFGLDGVARLEEVTFHGADQVAVAEGAACRITDGVVECTGWAAPVHESSPGYADESTDAPVSDQPAPTPK